MICEYCGEREAVRDGGILCQVCRDSIDSRHGTATVLTEDQKQAVNAEAEQEFRRAFASEDWDSGAPVG